MRLKNLAVNLKYGKLIPLIFKLGNKKIFNIFSRI